MSFIIRLKSLSKKYFFLYFQYWQLNVEKKILFTTERVLINIQCYAREHLQMMQAKIWQSLTLFHHCKLLSTFQLTLPKDEKMEKSLAGH